MGDLLWVEGGITVGFAFGSTACKGECARCEHNGRVDVLVLSGCIRLLMGRQRSGPLGFRIGARLPLSF